MLRVERVSPISPAPAVSAAAFFEFHAATTDAPGVPADLFAINADGNTGLQGDLNEPLHLGIIAPALHL